MAHFTQLWRFVSSCEAVPTVAEGFSWSDFFFLPAVNIDEGRNPLHCSFYTLPPVTCAVLLSGVWCFICILGLFFCFLFLCLCIRIPVGHPEWSGWVTAVVGVTKPDGYECNSPLCSCLETPGLAGAVPASAAAAELSAPHFLCSTSLIVSTCMRESSLFPASVLWWETPSN